MSLVRSALRQPLVYFVLLGATVFAVDAALRPARNIQVSEAVENEVLAELARTLGRAPTKEELEGALDEWVDTELLFREALALGLDQNDAVIRNHLAQKLAHVVRERSVLADPTEAELRAQLEANPARYTRPDTYDVRHVFIARPGADDHPARVASALDALRAGANADGVGDHFPRGPVFTDSTRLQLEQALGIRLLPELAADRVQQWQSVSGPRGTHLVRLEAIHSGAPDLDRSRDALVKDVSEQKKRAALARFLTELRERTPVGE